MKLRAIMEKIEHIKVQQKELNSNKNKKEKLIIKSIITEIRNPINNLIRRLATAKEIIIELPKLKNKTRKNKKINRPSKNDGKFQKQQHIYHWNTRRKGNICRDKSQDKKLSKLITDTKPQIQESLSILYSTNTKKYHAQPYHVKTSETKRKRKY